MRETGPRRYADALLDLLLPRECVGCGVAGTLLCGRCSALVGPVSRRQPSPVPPGFPPCWSAGAYEGALRAALLGLKERGRRDLNSVLAGHLSGAAQAAHAALRGDRRVLLVPVPSAAAAAAQRGGDHLRRLARALDPVAAEVALLLVVRRGTPDAAGLRAAERAVARQAAFGLRPGAGRLVHGADVVLLDDVVTTGWTLAVCAGLLRGAGAREVVAATVAATERG